MRRSKFSTILLSYIGQMMLSFIFRTSRWKILGIENFNAIVRTGKPVMLCVWHGRFTFPAFWLAKNKIHAHAIASRHGDAAVIAKIFKRWGFGLIRGSSSSRTKDKGGRDVIKEMSRIFNLSGTNIVAVTNDGPKGPARIAKSGSLALALKKNVQIITITGTASSVKIFKSWDRFCIPKPFSTIYLNIAPIFEIPPDELTLEEKTQYLSDYINKYQDEIDEFSSKRNQ